MEGIDPCALLTPAEVAAVGGGEPSDEEEQEIAAYKQCDWEGVGEGGDYTGALSLRGQHNPLYSDSAEDLVDFLTWDGISVGHPDSGQDGAAAYATHAERPDQVILYALHVEGLILWSEVSAPDLTTGSEKFEELKTLMGAATERLSAR